VNPLPVFACPVCGDTSWICLDSAAIVPIDRAGLYKCDKCGSVLTILPAIGATERDNYLIVPPPPRVGGTE